jgi:hypothetical protein
MRGESTQMLDKNGNEIFVGDTVRKQWGLWRHKDGKPTWDDGPGVTMEPEFRDHVIKKVREENSVRYLLGDCHNIWSGEEVELLRWPK